MTSIGQELLPTEIKTLESYPSDAHAHRRLLYMNAQEFEQKFDDGEEDIIDMLDLSKAKRPFADQKNVNISLPTWIIELIHQEANRLGVTPQVVIQNSLTKQLTSNHS